MVMCYVEFKLLENDCFILKVLDMRLFVYVLSEFLEEVENLKVVFNVVFIV